MKLYISSDVEGAKLKQVLLAHLVTEGFEVEDVSPERGSFLESVDRLADNLAQDEMALGIAIDAYGAGSFMAATKHPHLVAAQVSDERSAYMTREHNNSRLITLGSEIVGEGLAKNICVQFAKANYDGGRHQVRVDMLMKMC